MLDVLALTQALIEKPSITPNDAGCQTILKDYLAQLGFRIVDLPSGPVSNFWAEIGEGAPLFVFAGHTDVVPVGDVNAWEHDPFKPVILGEFLYGRGAQDMKSGLAAMLVATKQFLEKNHGVKGSIGFLITSGEEGDFSDQGTPVVLEYLKKQHKKIDWCVVGEPSSVARAGDTIRNGRRGSVHGYLTVHGTMGHVAYPHLADNPIHKALPALTALSHQHWDEGDVYFRPTTFQITNIQGGTGAGNVIPDTLSLRFNFRNAPTSSSQSLITRTEAILNEYELKYTLRWDVSAEPFLTEPGILVDASMRAIENELKSSAQLDTGGGTSDARYLAPTGCEVIEVGVPNNTIHQVNEQVRVEDIHRLVNIYESLLNDLFVKHENR